MAIYIRCLQFAVVVGGFFFSKKKTLIFSQLGPKVQVAENHRRRLENRASGSCQRYVFCKCVCVCLYVIFFFKKHLKLGRVLQIGYTEKVADKETDEKHNTTCL